MKPEDLEMEEMAKHHVEIKKEPQDLYDRSELRDVDLYNFKQETSSLENQIDKNEQFFNDNVNIEEDKPLKKKKRKKKSMKFLPLANVPEPVKKKVAINATIPTFSVNNLSRKAQDIFKESIGKKSENVVKPFKCQVPPAKHSPKKPKPSTSSTVKCQLSTPEPKQFRVQFKCTKCQFSTYEVDKLTEHTKNVHVQFNEKICDVHAEKSQMQIKINVQESYRKLLKKKRSYASLITEALDNAPNWALSIADIYKAINARHPEYSLTRCSGWQNSIRHNLSLHKNFIREGKYWKLAYPDNSISTSKVQNSIEQDLDIGVKHNELGENSLVDKVITNVKTDNVSITPKLLKIIPIEKFPKKDKTTSIFKCQIPPKKIPKPS